MNFAERRRLEIAPCRSVIRWGADLQAGESGRLFRVMSANENDEFGKKRKNQNRHGRCFVCCVFRTDIIVDL